MYKLTMLSGPVALLAAAAMATAGPAWVEGGGGDSDAGSLPPSAQNTQGSGPMAFISGNLDGTTGATGEGDFEDMYVINILDPATFCATTAFAPAFTEFDSRLYLFRIETNGDILGFGLLGNEDTGGPLPGDGLVPFGDIQTGACCFPDGSCLDLDPKECFNLGGEFQGIGTDCYKWKCDEHYGACCIEEEGCVDLLYTECQAAEGIFMGNDTFCEDGIICPDPDGSTMGNVSTDGTDIEITQPGLYLLAITVTPRQPVSGGAAIFYFPTSNTTEVSGPDGPGGEGEITDWMEPIPGWGTQLPLAAAVDDVPGEYMIMLCGVGFAQPAGLELPLDIKPGGCPNSFNNKNTGYGKLPVALVGTGDFDVSTVDTSTLSLSRADGVGGSVTPLAHHTRIGDVATPFDGDLCDCHELEGDGIHDLKLKFRRTTMVEVMELGDVPGGELVELVLAGELTDGTAFTARDCIRLVPPHVGEPSFRDPAATWGARSP
ncbi:MAG: hypothetical protein ACYSWT_09905 [Planctomycetota bacterium]|jgi:hypothetical protein